MLALSLLTAQATGLPLVCPPGPIWSKPAGTFTVEEGYIALDDHALGYHVVIDREVPFELRFPHGVAGARPLVVVSHGGGWGETDPSAKMQAWSDHLAEQGYVVATLAHTPRTDRQRYNLCNELGIQATLTPGFLGNPPTVGGDCAAYKWLHHDRPRDVSAALDAIEALADARIDMDHVMVLGWSAGAGGAQLLAGATREPWPGLTPDGHTDDRVDAVVALSPQGIGNDGYTVDSYDTIDLPILFLTGSGDSKQGTRRDAYQEGPTGVGLAELWLEHGTAKHTFYGNLDMTKCDDSVDPCTGMRGALRDAALAWADAHLDQNACAQAWLDQGKVLGRTALTLEWSQK